MQLKERVRNILLEPKHEWEVIAGEDTGIGALYRGYIVPLAAIGPVALLVRFSFMGGRMSGGGHLQSSPWSGLGQAVLAFALNMAAVFVLALLVDVLAPTFGGRKNSVQALKVAAYASTPGWIASVFVLVPILTILALVAGSYGLYLLYLGLPPVMGAPRERALGYTVVVVIAVVLVYIVMGLVAGMVMPPMMPSGPVH
ncbi:MAG TPA: YIP1 family protein, partial [Chromatiales bacterium]|nr:YIP1 family protein [Chromatiales bacterium]